MIKSQLKQTIWVGLFFLILGSANAAIIEKQIFAANKAELTVKLKGAKGNVLGLCSGKSLQNCANAPQSCSLSIDSCGLTASIVITNNSSLTALNVLASSSDITHFGTVIQENSQHNPNGCTLGRGESCTITFSNNNFQAPSFQNMLVTVSGLNTNTACFKLSYFQ